LHVYAYLDYLSLLSASRDSKTDGVALPRQWHISAMAGLVKKRATALSMHSIAIHYVFLSFPAN
jgi:hypothetical protein